MQLIDFIAEVKANLGIDTPIKDLEEMCYKKAKEAAGRGNAVGIDDKTVREWIEDYDAWKANDEAAAKEKREALAKEKAEYNAAEAKRKAALESEARQKALEKEKAEKEKEGQLSLWDIM